MTFYFNDMYMKDRLLLVAAFLCAVFSLYAQDKNDGIDLADPFILLDGDTYYAYGTMGSRGIEVFTSDDLRTWKHAGLALDKNDSYADRWFWAPEVYHIGDRYIMYYSADEHVCAAESDSPLGPFRQKVQAPMLESKSIDNSLFIDSDGKPYMYFCFLDGGNKVWVTELEDDFVTVRPGTMTFCIEKSQPWETESVNEGSFVIKHAGRYYLTYSGNDFRNPAYGIGFATSDSPVGPWTKYEGNPIFCKPQTKTYGPLEGVGHHALFRDKEGRLRVAFHAHRKPGLVQPRQMYISTVTFTDDAAPVMKISSDDITKARLAD